MLHLVFQTPIETAILERFAPGDDVVFLESSVLRLLEKGNMRAVLTPLLAQNQLHVLQEDIELRGIQPEELIIGLKVIDYPGLVALTVKNPLIQSWT